MPLSAARQRSAVSGGIAIGVVTCGHQVIPFEKFRVDHSFSAAWNSWQYRAAFSQVDTDLRQGKGGALVMTHADASTKTSFLYWENSGSQLSIHPKDVDWDPSDDKEIRYALSQIGGNVPLEGWVSLAREFLTHMDL